METKFRVVHGENKYSVNKLIELVKIRPALWDRTRKDYRSFLKWEEVYASLDERYRSSDQRTRARIGLRITTKWKNIKDAFIRSVKKRAQDGRVKKYMHHDQLQFLMKIINIDDDLEIPQRRLSSLSDSTTENLTDDGITYDGGSEENPIITVIKVEFDEEPTVYNNPVSPDIKVKPEEDPLTENRNVEPGEEPKHFNNLVTPDIKVEPEEEPTDCNNPVTAGVKFKTEEEQKACNDPVTITESLQLENENEKPLNVTEENFDLKRRYVDLGDKIEESRISKVQRIEMEIKNQPVQRKEHTQPPVLNDNNLFTVREVDSVHPSPPDEDESFFASILSLVRSMTDDDKLEFRMAVLELIHDTRLRKRTYASKRPKQRRPQP